jgi:hypothetical protein
VFGLAYRGEDKKASAAAWIVLVSRSRKGMIFPVHLLLLSRYTG